MKGLPQRSPVIEAASDKRHRGKVAQRPQELLKIQRKHLNTLLLRRYDNVLNILSDANKRTCFNIVVSSILHEIFYQLPCSWILLHLVKYNDRRPFVERCRVEGGKLREKEVQIRAVIFKQIKDLHRCVPKVDHYITLVLVLSELSAEIAFSNSSRTVDHQCAGPSALILPLQQTVIQFSFEDDRILFLGHGSSHSSQRIYLV